MQETTSSPPVVPTAGSNLFQKLASFCVWFPLIAIGVNMVTATQQPNLVTAAAVPVLGIVSGIIALFGILRHGRAGILWKSVAGLLIWGLLAAAAVPAFLSVQTQAKALHDKQHDSAVP